MKFMLALLVLAVVAMAYSKPSAQSSRGCIYIMGRCHRECEEGTHAYTTGCGQKTPEPTCDNPNPEKEPGNICDYSACYCDAPTVRDPITKKCVTLDQCSKKEESN